MNYKARILALLTLCTGTVAPIITEQLVNIETAIPTIARDIRYATTNNFTHRQIYSHPGCYLVESAAKALLSAQNELRVYGLGLKIWDAYRPLPAQWALWKLVPDPRYVSDPEKGGRHTRGTAVDCTLVELWSGRELGMPTEFDNFTPRAWRDDTQCTPQARFNRALLQDIMHKYGFVGLPTEWWHFDFAGWEQYEVLSVTFEELAEQG